MIADERPLHATLIRLPESLYQRCRAYSFENNVSIAHMARIGLIRYLNANADLAPRAGSSVKSGEPT